MRKGIYMKNITKALLLLIMFILCGCGQQIHQPKHNIFAQKPDSLTSQLVAIILPDHKLELVTIVGVTSYDLNNNAKMIIYSTLDYDYEQLVIIPQDEKEQMFTDVKKYLRHPQISTDGAKIVFEARDNITGDAQILIMDRLSKKMEPFFTDNIIGMYPRWSNDGKNISLLLHSTSCPEDLPESCFDLSIASVESRQIIKTISGPIEDNYPVSWSPDSNEIAFSRWKNGSYHLVIYNLNKNAENEVQNNGTNDKMSIWSDNGDQLAFSRSATGDQNNSEICILENEIPECIDQKGSEVTGLFWIDNQTILFGVYDKPSDATTVKILDTTTKKYMVLGVYSGYLDSFQALK